MLRKIISINESKCNGCGLCVTSCHEKAIQIIDGKAKLIKDDYCDGLGDCLGHCPNDAIKIVLKDTVMYDEVKTQEHIKSLNNSNKWPIQIKLVNPNSDYLYEANLVICATCSGFVCNIKDTYIKNDVCLVGCTKLDGVDYSVKLSEIIKHNKINNIKIIKMDVPCCEGLYQAVIKAIKDVNSLSPKIEVITLNKNGDVI